MRASLAAIIVAVAIAGVLVANVFFAVSETEQAIVLQFGAQKEVIRTAGLNVKVPIVQNVVKFDKRILTAEDSWEVPDKDRQRLKVDAFVRYKIDDPLKFYQSIATEEAGAGRMKILLGSSLRNVIANTTIASVLSEKRDEVMGSIRTAVATSAQAFGIVVVDVQIRRTDLPPQNVESIVNRMVAERTREANQARAEGNEINVKITAEADRAVTVIDAEARKQAEVTMGQGDAERNRIYAEAFSKDPDFFAFYRSLIAYKKALGPNDTTMVISPTSEFFRYLGSDRGK